MIQFERFIRENGLDLSSYTKELTEKDFKDLLQYLKEISTLFDDSEQKKKYNKCKLRDQIKTQLEENFNSNRPTGGKGYDLDDYPFEQDAFGNRFYHQKEERKILRSSERNVLAKMDRQRS